MKNKKIVLLILLLLMIGSAVFFIRRNSKLNRNHRQVSEQLLSKKSGSSGKAGELFDYDYEELYVFDPYQPKESMEKQIGFESGVLRETLNENMMNVLFVKADEVVAYFYGYGGNEGYYLDLPAGHYSKAELEEADYQVQKTVIGHSSGKERSYLNYQFNF